MDQDDPEKRIAELERQLAEQNRIPSRERHEDSVTSRCHWNDIHNVAFTKPPFLKRGYHEDEVDAFLERVEATLRDPTAPGAVTPAEIHQLAFSKPPIGKRGYNEDEVDAFLELVSMELTRQLPGRGGP